MKFYKKEDIFKQLEDMNAPRNSIVLLHSSFRLIGNVEGGAEGFLDVLIDYFTQDGGLVCIPTHTWHNLNQEITLDMGSDNTALGVFSTVALRDGRGIRSENPISSMVVFGDRAKAEKFVAEDAYITSATAPESCYGKLFSNSGHVLLVGVAQNRNTYIHAVDEILQIKNRMNVDPIKVKVKRVSGEVVERDLFLYHSSFCSDISARFIKYDIPFRYHSCIVDGYIGDAPTQLCDARKIKDVIERIYENSDGIDPLENEQSIPPKVYCFKL